MPAHFPFPIMDMASGYRDDFTDHLAKLMPEMGPFCADRLRLEAKVVWISGAFNGSLFDHGCVVSVQSQVLGGVLLIGAAGWRAGLPQGEGCFSCTRFALMALWNTCDLKRFDDIFTVSMAILDRVFAMPL
ncbi:MAG: hypothetical protein JXR15_11440 [Shimia sp.]